MRKIKFLLPLLLAALLIGCEKEEASLGPKVKLYRTNANYIDNVAATINSDGSVHFVSNANPHINNGDTIYNTSRIALANGYVLDAEGLIPFDGLSSVFLNLTFKEVYIIGNDNRLSYVIDNIESQNLVLDSDPYLEVYEDNTPDRMFDNYFWRTMETPFSHSDTAFLNQVIRNGEITKYFKQIK